MVTPASFLDPHCVHRPSGREKENQREKDSVITISSFFQRHLLWVHEISDEVADLPGGEGAE